MTARSEAASSIRELAHVLQGEVILDELMVRHTTFRVGGKASALVYPQDEEDLKSVVTTLADAQVPIKVLGNGSNLLVSDRGISGVVVKLGRAFHGIRRDANSLLVGAGVPLAQVVKFAAQQGLSGLESTVGIPGTLGGAIATNAGTDTGHMGDLVQQVTVMDSQGRIKACRPKELNYSYRRSSILNSGLIVLEARLKLTPNDPAKIRAKMKRLGAKRGSRQPLKCRSAGCVFMNPCDIDLAAGKLLDRAGAKGLRQGDAQVSSKHANFIVNRGQATAGDIRTLIARLQESVMRAYGVMLEPEIEFVGEW